MPPTMPPGVHGLGASGTRHERAKPGRSARRKLVAGSPGNTRMTEPRPVEWARLRAGKGKLSGRQRRW